MAAAAPVVRARPSCRLASPARGDAGAAGWDAVEGEQSTKGRERRTVPIIGELRTILAEAFMREFLAQWADYRLIAEDFRDVDTRVFVAGRQAARGKQSGAEVEQPMHSVWTFRGGKIVGLRFTPLREEALEAVGLRE